MPVLPQTTSTALVPFVYNVDIRPASPAHAHPRGKTTLKTPLRFQPADRTLAPGFSAAPPTDKWDAEFDRIDAAYTPLSVQQMLWRGIALSIVLRLVVQFVF